MKRLIIGILVLFLISMNCAFTFKFESSNPTIKVGLKNMTSSNINIILNGNYSFNNSIFNSGTSLSLTIKDGKISNNIENYEELILVPQAEGNTIRLEIGAKKYSYKGTMDFKISGNSILPINIIDLETYLKGVVAYEMSNSYPLEALKAQAVAARNYTLADIGKHKSTGYDLCDTTDCQVYRGYNASYLNVTRAVDETRGKVLVYGDELVSAYYGASTGGYTEASGNIWSKQLPYLISKKDEMENENWPYGNQVFNSSSIDSTLKSKNYLKPTDKFEKIDLQSIVRNLSGRVSSIDILYINSSGTETRKSLTKEAPRTFLSLPSSLFNVVYDEATDTYTFSGKGYGHGVGMSQIGAKNRANAGQAYDTILYFYYDGTSIVDINDKIKNDNIDIPQSTGGAIDIEIPKTTGSAIQLPPKTSGPAIQIPPKNPVVETPVVQVPPPSPAKGEEIKVSIPKPNEPSKQSVVNFPRVLKKGMSGNDVKSLQDALKKLKYLNITKTTNYFGGTTEAGVKSFQKKQIIKVTGIADRTTLDKLTNLLVATKEPNQNKVQNNSVASKIKTATIKTSGSADKTKLVLSSKKVLQKGMKGTDVKQLQQALKNLGFFKDNTNGVYGAITEAAVKSFQKNNGLTVLGKVDYLTVVKINQKLNS